MGSGGGNLRCSASAGSGLGFLLRVVDVELFLVVCSDLKRRILFLVVFHFFLFAVVWRPFAELLRDFFEAVTSLSGNFRSLFLKTLEM